MAAGKYNLRIEQGATLDKLFTTVLPNGNPANYTGYTARMQIRKDWRDSTVALELSTANGRIELGGTLGTVRLIVAAADTMALTRGGVYDIELVSSGGVVTRFLQGKVILDPNVTR